MFLSLRKSRKFKNYIPSVYKDQMKIFKLYKLLCTIFISSFIISIHVNDCNILQQISKWKIENIKNHSKKIYYLPQIDYMEEWLKTLI